MKPNRATIKKPSGKPNSPKTEAKPKPCSKPKIKIIIGLHLLSLSKIIFSTAIKTIDKAIRFQNFGHNIQRNTTLYPYDVFEIKMPIENDVSLIQSMLGDKNTRFSKYCLSIETLKNIKSNSFVKGVPAKYAKKRISKF